MTGDIIKFSPRRTRGPASPVVGRLRIAHVVRQFWPSAGGLEAHVAQLAQEQAKSASVYVLTLDRIFGKPERMQRLERHGRLVVVRMPFIGYRRLFVPFLALKLLKRFDVVHVHGLDQCADAVGLLSMFGAPPFVMTSHGLFFHTDRYLTAKRVYFHTISRVTLSHASSVFSVSKSDQAQLQNIGVASTLTRNPVTCFEYLYRAGDDLLYVGRLSENKNIDKLIPFMARLRAAGGSHQLHIVGSGEEQIRHQLASDIARHGLEAVVRLHGHLSGEQLQSLILRCGFAVSASRYEGFGMAVVEAMSAGLLPVMQPNDAFREICRDSGCGLLIDFDRPEAAAASFLRWKETLTGEDRTKARDYALTASFPALADRIHEHYRAALGASNRSGPGQPSNRDPVQGHCPTAREHAPAPLQTRRILGVDVCVCRKHEALGLLLDRLAARKPTTVGFANANLLTQISADPRRAALLQGALVFNDGVGTDIASFLLYGERFVENLNGTDFTPELLAALPPGTRVFLYGARPDVVARAARTIGTRYPVKVCGYQDGYAVDGARVVDHINTAKTDVVLVALGNPLQEEWMARYRHAVDAPLLIGVGALFDFVAGAVPRAPAWVRRIRLEWTFRLAQEPRRLSRRYTSDIVRFLALVFAQRLERHNVS